MVDNKSSLWKSRLERRLAGCGGGSRELRVAIMVSMMAMAVTTLQVFWQRKSGWMKNKLGF